MEEGKVFAIEITDRGLLLDRQLEIAESLLDWVDVKMLELRTEDYSQEELERKYQAVTRLIRGYRARDEELSTVLRQEEWLKLRKQAFPDLLKIH